MAAPMALQLYSIRDHLAGEFEGNIRQVAEMGYLGVEPTGGTVGKTPAEGRRLFDELGLAVPSIHQGIPPAEELGKTLDLLAALGCKNWVVPWMPAEQFQTPDQVKAVCARINETNAFARKNGLSLYYHNHSWEFRPTAGLGGRTPFDLMVNELDESIGFEFDLYWAKVGGTDPLELVRTFGSRAPFLHIKDGPVTLEDPMTAVGDGVMDYQTIIKASEATTKWLIVEIDRCATDMMEAVRKSAAYLTQQGLARGNKR